MSEAHDLLTGEDRGQVPMSDIVARAIAAFDASRFTVQGDDTTLSSPKALLLAMALHELGTNAVKYGALYNTEGRIALDWKSAGDRVTLHWQESGGPAVTLPERRGFGTNLIQRAMAGEGGASFDYASDGLKGDAGNPPLKLAAAQAPQPSMGVATISSQPQPGVRVGCM